MAAPPPSHMWYVRAAGGVWGPYPEARVAGFAAEGRVVAETPVSPWAEGPFTPAGANPEFAPLVRPRAAPSPPATLTVPPDRSDPLPPQAAPIRVEEAPVRSGPTQPLLVWAEVSPDSAPGFHAALEAAGAGAAIRPGLWLVRSPESPAALRNRLSRRLGTGDALIVVQVPLEQASWFNLDPARDRELRRLWSAPAEAASRRDRLG